MPLLVSTLSSGLASVFAGVDSFAAAGAGWASAYAAYAQAAQAAGALPVFTGAEETLLASSLTAAFAAGAASEGVSLLAAVEAAFIAFWYTPPAVFGAGVVSLAPPGLGALIGGTFAANLAATTSADAAGNVAAVLDAWTRTIVVTFPGGATSTLV